MAMMFEVEESLGLLSGDYVLRLKSIEQDTEPPKYGTKPRNKWTFVVDDVLELDDPDADFEDLIGREVIQWATASMAPNSNQYTWLKGMLNKDKIEKGERIDSADLTGKPFKVTWGTKTYKLQSGETVEKDTILKITPYRPRRERNAPQREERTRSVEREDGEDF